MPSAVSGRAPRRSDDESSRSQEIAMHAPNSHRRRALRGRRWRLPRGPGRGRRPLRAELGLARPAAHAAVVPRRQVRHLHPLGRLLRAGLGRGRRIRRVVLEPHRRPEARRTSGGSSTRRTTARRSTTRTSPRCSRPSCSTPTSGPTSSPAPGRSTSCPPRSTTTASPSGPAPRPAAPGAAPGTPSRSAPSATCWASWPTAVRKQAA